MKPVKRADLMAAIGERLTDTVSQSGQIFLSSVVGAMGSGMPMAMAAR